MSKTPEDNYVSRITSGDISNLVLDAERIGFVRIWRYDLDACVTHGGKGATISININGEQGLIGSYALRPADYHSDTKEIQSFLRHVRLGLDEGHFFLAYAKIDGEIMTGDLYKEIK